RGRGQPRPLPEGDTARALGRVEARAPDRAGCARSRGRLISPPRSGANPCAPLQGACACRLDVEAEVHDVAVADDVVLAFEAHPAGVLGAMLAPARDVIVVGDRLGADEALLEIR